MTDRIPERRLSIWDAYIIFDRDIYPRALLYCNKDDKLYNPLYTTEKIKDIHHVTYITKRQPPPPPKRSKESNAKHTVYVSPKKMTTPRAQLSQSQKSPVPLRKSESPKKSSSPKSPPKKIQKIVKKSLSPSPMNIKKRSSS
jgi:hypothetical protein